MEQKWLTLLGLRSKPGVERLVGKQGLTQAKQIVMAEMVMKKLQEDLGPVKVNELRVDCIYIEHTLQRVQKLLIPMKQDDINCFMKQT